MFITNSVVVSWLNRHSNGISMCTAEEQLMHIFLQVMDTICCKKKKKKICRVVPISSIHDGSDSKGKQWLIT